MSAQGGGRGTFWRPFLALFGLGLVGIVALIPILLPQLRRVVALPGAPELPLGVLAVLALGQTAVMTALLVAIGVLLAPRLGLRSHVAARAAGQGRPVPEAIRPELPLALALGAATGIGLVAFDLLTLPFMGPAWREAAAAQERTLALTLAGILYGGITEELWVRWGLVSLLAWIPWRLFQRAAGAPAPAAMWGAIAVAALLFGAGHLGYAASLVPLTPPVVARVVVGNALGGLVFGWLFWRRSLESAMIAHASAHVVISLIAWSGLPAALGAGG